MIFESFTEGHVVGVKTMSAFRFSILDYSSFLPTSPLSGCPDLHQKTSLENVAQAQL